MNNLVFFGFKGCGKTYWGKRLSQVTGYSFIDTDRVLEKLYQKDHDLLLSCSDIYKTIGEREFREYEHDAIASLSGEKNCIIALGAGAILSQKNLKVIEHMGLLVYLKIDKEILKKRIFSGPLPAFFDPKCFQDSFESYYAERLPLYENIPSYVLQLDKMSETKIIKSLKDKLYGK